MIKEIASKEIGYVEDKGNKTKYGSWFGFDGVAWCAMFVSWVYAQAGRQLPNIGFKKGFAGCQTMYTYAKENKLFTKNPKEGDIIIFDFNGDKRFDHTGIFISWANKEMTKINTIEGNTSIKNQNNGGMVMKRIRSTKNVLFIQFPESLLNQKR